MKKDKTFFPKMWLHQKYWVEGLSLKEIGQIALSMFPHYPYSKEHIAHKVRNDLKRHGIRRRNKSESAKLAHKTLGHKTRMEKTFEDAIKAMNKFASTVEKLNKLTEKLKKEYPDAIK